MKHTLSALALTFALSTPAIAIESQLYKASYYELPRSVEVVNQLEYKYINSYNNEKARTHSQWWMCGAAAFATALNVLNTEASNDVEQLEWFHTKLLKYPRYKSYLDNPHREAYGDDLEKVINSIDGNSAEKKTTKIRDTIKEYLHTSLVSSDTQQIVALTKKSGWGHFVVVHEIKYDPSGANGGYVKFADPYGGYSSVTMGYTQFLNGMRDAGTQGRYSFWLIK